MLQVLQILRQAVLRRARPVPVRVAVSLVLGGLLVSGVLGLLGSLEAAAAPLAQAGTRGVLTVTEIVRSGNGVSETVYQAAGEGHKFFNAGDAFVQISNDYTATITATFVTPILIDGLAVADLVITIPVAATRFVGPFPPARYNQPTGADRNHVYLNWNAAITGPAAALVRVGAYRLGD